MIKVVIVVWGLVLFVPDGSPDKPGPGMTTLFLNAEHLDNNHKHAGLFVNYESPGRKNVWSVDPAYFNVKLKVKGAMPTPALSAIPKVRTFLDGGDKLALRKECLAPSGCKVGDKRLTIGQVRFDGAWATEPASYCHPGVVHPIKFSDEAIWKFYKGSQHHSKLPGVDGRIATAMVFEAEVQDLSDIELWIDGVKKESSLQKATPGICKDWVGLPSNSGKVQECVYLEMASVPAVPPDPDCANPNPPQKCKIDHHFVALYEVLESASGPYWIPQIDSRYGDCRGGGGIGTPPAIRCPGGYAYAITEEAQ